MKLKDLLICMAGIFFCTSCIQEEAPNAEADILSCTLPDNVLEDPKVTIDVYEPFDEQINAYPIHIEVKEGTNLTQLAPELELTPGATVTPESGSIQDFTSPVKYIVTSEDKKWQRTYSIKVTAQTPSPSDTPNIPTLFHFENVKEVGKYYVFTETVEDRKDVQWASGNEGFAWTGSGDTPSGFPTTQSNNGVAGKCLKLETMLTGSLGALAKKPIAAGNLFMGKFNMGIAISRPLEATQFGVSFNRKPTRLVGYYKYTAGPKFYVNGEYTNQKDIFNIYALFYKKTDEVPWLNGHIAEDNYKHPNMVALAIIDNPHETNEWTKFDLPFDYQRYDKTINEEDLQAGKYCISIIMASSKDGDLFQGAPGSTLLIDEIEIKYE